MQTKYSKKMTNNSEKKQTTTRNKTKQALPFILTQSASIQFQGVEQAVLVVHERGVQGAHAPRQVVLQLQVLKELLVHLLVDELILQGRTNKVQQPADDIVRVDAFLYGVSRA
jgi:hypothetical protein